MILPTIASSRSATTKVAIIAFLVLVLLIPVSMIRDVISDRSNNESVAVRDIRHAWGGQQIVTGPVLRLPYAAEKITVYGSPFAQSGFAYILSNQLTIKADVVTEVRYRGIHKVPVYSAAIAMRGTIDLTLLEKLGIDARNVDWSGAELLLGVSESTAIAKIPVINANGADSKFETASSQVAGLPTQLSAAVGKQLDEGDRGSALELDISLHINGTGSLRFLPLAESSEVIMTSPWPAPSFAGRQLPRTREVREDGFDATWLASSLGRKLPAYWLDTHAAPGDVADAAFGVNFIQPVGLYQLMHRATKYAVLFVGLTFVSFFLVEVVGNLKLHPLQYLLVGLANTLFYMLLLSLAEHVGFDTAYVISALASAALIAGYSAAILVRRIRALLIAAVLAGLYTFLYLTLKAESFALLAGSLGLWLVLAVVMYLTRGINWYASSDDARLEPGRTEP